MSLFTAQKMTIKKNVIKTVNRQPVSGYEDVVDTDGNIIVVPCRVTGTDNGNIKLFVLKKFYEKIPDGLHKNFQVKVEGYNQTYVISKEPIWAGGVMHHIEADLEELV